MRVQNYEIVTQLGRPRSDTDSEAIYEVIDQKSGQKYRLKVLNPGLEADQYISASFKDEIKSIARVSHPSIAKLIEFGQFEGTYFLVYEYVEGSFLSEILEKEEFSLGRALSILSSLAGVLAYVHSFGVVHRDLKPQNIILRKDNSVLITDLGIAKFQSAIPRNITDPQPFIGTPAYMSPEQVEGNKVSPASDVYALGILAFQLLTGQLPFTADTMPQLLLKHVTESPPRLIDLFPDVPGTLSDLIGQMLQKSPEGRPQAKVVREVLREIHKEVERMGTASKVLYIPATSPERRAIEVKATYIMGGKVVQPPLDDELVYFDE